MSNLPRPPKFGPDTIGPTTPNDWAAFYRWLVSLWEVSQGGTDIVQILSVARQQSPQNPAIAEAAGLAMLAVSRVPYPVRQASSQLVIEDTHANRASYAASSYPNALYWETDRTVYYLSDGVNWIYTAGEMKCTQATLPADLGANDRYFVADVTDYNHRLLWGSASGVYASGWDWAPGDEGSGRIVAALIDPTGTGWHLCDGSAGVSYLKGDGTTATVTLPDLTSAANKAAYLKWGSPASATPTAAAAPTLTMNAYTPAGTNSAPTFTGTALGTHQHTLPFGVGVSFIAFGNNPYGTGATISSLGVVTGGALGGTFLGAKDEPVSAGTPAGTVSTPTFTGTPATLTGAISATGEPRNVMLRPWFRQ